MTDRFKSSFLLAAENFFRVRAGVRRRRARRPEYDAVRGSRGPAGTIDGRPGAVVEIGEGVVKSYRRRASVGKIGSRAHSRSRAELRRALFVAAGVSPDSGAVISKGRRSDEGLQRFRFQYRDVGLERVDFVFQILQTVDHLVPFRRRERRRA